MSKQIIITVPDGYVAKVDDKGVTFVKQEKGVLDYDYRDFTTFTQCLAKLIEIKGTDIPAHLAAKCLYDHYLDIPSYAEYEFNIIKARIIMFVLTKNEKRSLVKGNYYIPFIQICEKGKEEYSSCNTPIGTIVADNNEYSVLCGNFYYGSSAGLAGLHGSTGFSGAFECTSFIQTSNKNIAKHFSKHFGRLLFEIQYGGCNCDYRWADDEETNDKSNTTSTDAKGESCR